MLGLTLIVVLSGALWVTGRRFKLVCAMPGHCLNERAMNGIAVTTEVEITTVNEEAISGAGAVMRIPTPIGPINVEHALGFVKLEQVVIFERHAFIRMSLVENANIPLVQGPTGKLP
jgi:hypothetical protein